MDIREKNKVLDWLTDIGQHALTEARGGNSMPANKLGSNVALKHYFDNVVCLKSIHRDTWAATFPHYFAEAQRMVTEYEAMQESGAETDNRLATVEAQLKQFKAELAEARELLEAQAEAEVEPVDESESVDETDDEAETEQNEPVEDEPEADDADDTEETDEPETDED